MLNNTGTNCQACHALPGAERPMGVAVENEVGQSVFRSMQPIDNLPECSECHDPNQPIIGLILTDIAIKPFESAVALEARNTILWWVGTILLIIILVNLAISRFVIRRIGKLVAAIDRFGEDFRAPTLATGSRDEIGQMASAFRAMAERIINHEGKNRELTRALSKRMAERNQLLRRLINAQEEERKRVARELHDDLGQGLSAMALSVELAQKALDHDVADAKSHLDQVDDLIAESTERMYDLILGLRPSALDDIGLVPALRSLISRTLEPAGIACKLDVADAQERLPPEVETVMFRLFQEAITNIMRHSRAGEVKLRLAKGDGRVDAEIIDDGVGFEQEDLKTGAGREGGLGLLGMRERVDQFGGEIKIYSRAGEGTRITINLPIDEVYDGKTDKSADRR